MKYFELSDEQWDFIGFLHDKCSDEDKKQDLLRMMLYGRYRKDEIPMINELKNKYKDEYNK